ncbi:MAG: HigA family addiction module antitoxin [Opitutaceae bacterium]
MSHTKEAQLIIETTPGGILLREFLEPLNLSQAELARRTGIPASRITEIIKGRRAITAETAIALSAFFGNSAQFWLNLQTGCDLRRAEILNASEIRARVRPLSVA